MKNTQHLIALLAITTNVIASSFFWLVQSQIDQTAADVYTALGNWFFMAALTLWIIFIVIILLTRKAKASPSPKKRTTKSTK